MKRLCLVVVVVLVLFATAMSSAGVNATSPPTVYNGTSPPIRYGYVWVLGLGYLWPGNVIKWNWSTTGDLSFRLAYTTAVDFKLVAVEGLQTDDGIVTNETGWYELDWYNNQPGNATVDYRVNVFIPTITPSSFWEGRYFDSRSPVVYGTTEGFATGVLVGTDPSNLHKASLTGNSWTSSLNLAEGVNTIILESYYWLKPSGTENITSTRRVNVTVDTVPPSISIVSPTNGTTIRGRAVQLYWNASDSIGILEVQTRVDGGEWSNVSWGNSLGTGYCQLGVSTGTHTIDLRATDRAGNQATASTSVRANSDDWSLGGPMYGLPTIGIVVAVIVFGLVTGLTYLRPRKEQVMPQVPAEPPKEPKS